MYQQLKMYIVTLPHDVNGFVVLHLPNYRPPKKLKQLISIPNFDLKIAVAAAV